MADDCSDFGCDFSAAAAPVRKVRSKADEVSSREIFIKGPKDGANGMSDIEGSEPDSHLAARVAVSEWSRGDARDIDGQAERPKWAGAHESTWAASEFQ